MVYVEFEYTLKKKKILIEGEVENKTFQYINLLLEINKRWYLDKVVDWLMRVFKYDGEEIGSVCVVAVAVIVTEIVSYVWFSPVSDPAITLTPQYKHSTFSHITLILCTLLSTTLTTFCRFTYRFYLCIVLSIILALIYGTIHIKQLEDYDITLSLLIVCSVCLLVAMYKRLINSKEIAIENSNKIINGFEFESSIVIGVYVVGKLKHFWELYEMTNHNMEQLEPSHLIPLISCILIITLLKIWSLFEFNPYYLVSLLTTIHNEENEELEKMSYFENFLIFGQHLAKNNSNENDNNDDNGEEEEEVINPLYLDNDNNDYNNEQQEHYDEEEYELPQPIKMMMDNVHEEEESQEEEEQEEEGSCSAINKPECGFQEEELERQNVEEELEQQQEENVEENNKSISEISSPYTSWIWLPMVLNVVHFIVILCLIILGKNNYTYTEIFIMSLGLCKPLILMLYSEHYNILMSQHQSPTHSYYHLLYLISDCFLALPIVICVLLLYNNLISLTNTYHLITILVNCYAPFHTKTIYRSLAKKMNITMSNHSMVHFYLIWMGLFQYRETIVIFSEEYFPSIYIIIDIILCTYAIFIIFIMSKLELYSEVYKEIKFILNMKNYKFYITESMKSWQFDITETSQILYCVNLLLLFTGYVVYKFNRKNELILSDGNYHEVVYLIVMLFAIAIHLLHSYNNFHTERLVVVKNDTHKHEESNNNNENNENNESKNKNEKIETKNNNKTKNPSTFNWYPPCWNYAILNIGILLYGIIVFLLYYFGSSNDSNILHNQEYYSKHMTYSVVAIICSIFATFVHAFMQQIYVAFTHFHSPLKLINLLISYFLFYFPFITLFALLYFNLNLEQQYIFYFAIGGFAYLTIACVAISIFVHAILNLTEKSKRTMFVNKKMSELFMEMKIKDDTEFLSMLENCYDQMDGNEGKMLEELEKENVYKLVEVMMSLGDGNNSHLDSYKYCFEEVDQYNHHNRKESHLHENVKIIASEEENDRQEQENKQTNNKQQYPRNKQEQPSKQLHSRKSIKITSFNNINTNILSNKKIITTNRKIEHEILELERNNNEHEFVERKYEKTREVTEFIKRYQVKRLKMRYERRKSNVNKLENKILEKKSEEESSEWKENIDEVILSQRNAATMPPNNKNIENPNINPKTLYPTIVTHLLTTLHNYTLIPQENFHLQEIKFTLSNILSILTKLFDFGYIYIYSSIYTLYAYSIEEYSNNRWILSFVNYHYVFLVALVGVVVYVGLIVYHKGEIVEGNLGVDENQRTVSFTSIRYYTTFLLFLMGSSLSNLFILTTLNSYMCDPITNNLWNFPENECYTFIHYAEMFFSLIILLSYYPLASLIFPFSSAIDRTLEIKYKSEFEIVYLQCKFLVNGINVIFNQLDFQTEELIKSITKTVLLLILTIMFYRMNPCSVGFVNKIELRVYIAMVIINCSGVLCYFVGVKVTVIVVGLVIMLFVIYSIVMCIKHQPTGDSFEASEPVVVNTTTTDNNFGQFIKENDPNTLIAFSEQLNNDSLVKLAPRSYGNKIFNEDNNQESLSIYQKSPVFYSRKKSMIESVNLEQTEVNSVVYKGSPKRSISPKRSVSPYRYSSPNHSISPSTTRLSSKFNPVENINNIFNAEENITENNNTKSLKSEETNKNINNNNKSANKKSFISNTINLRKMNNIKNNKNFSKQEFKLSLRQSQMFNNNTIISQEQLEQEELPTINMTRARSTYLGDELKEMSPTLVMMKHSSMSLVPQTRKVSITSNS